MTNLIVIDGTPGAYKNARRPKGPELRAIDGDRSLNKGFHNFRAGASPDGFGNAVAVLEAQLYAEDWFLQQVRGMMEEGTRSTGSNIDLTPYNFPNYMAKSGHDNLIHIAQFFFLLEALDCTKAEQIGAFIDSHNEKLHGLIKSGSAVMRENELNRAIFKCKRRLQVTQTVKFFSRPVFAIAEVGHLLIDLMSPRTTENLIRELVKGGVMRQRAEDDRPMDTDPRRVLVEPSEAFLGAYMESLLQVDRKLRAS